MKQKREIICKICGKLWLSTGRRTCYTCSSRENHRRQAVLRQAWLEGNGPCKRCSSWENLEVDHINPLDRKKGKYRYIFTLSKDVLREELKKCQVLCDKCHNEKSRIDIHIKLSKNSPYPGVRELINKTSTKWTAVIQRKGKKVYLGTFDSPEIAYEVYIQATRES